MLTTAPCYAARHSAPHAPHRTPRTTPTSLSSLPPPLPPPPHGPHPPRASARPGPLPPPFAPPPRTRGAPPGPAQRARVMDAGGPSRHDNGRALATATRGVHEAAATRGQPTPRPREACQREACITDCHARRANRRHARAPPWRATSGGGTTCRGLVPGRAPRPCTATAAGQGCRGCRGAARSSSSSSSSTGAVALLGSAPAGRWPMACWRWHVAREWGRKGVGDTLLLGGFKGVAREWGRKGVGDTGLGLSCGRSASCNRAGPVRRASGRTGSASPCIRCRSRGC
jgi:hypothetical protein